MHLSSFNQLDQATAAAHLYTCCGSLQWVDELMQHFPFKSEQTLIHTSRANLVQSLHPNRLARSIYASPKNWRYRQPKNKVCQYPTPSQQRTGKRNPSPRRCNCSLSPCQPNLRTAVWLYFYCVCHRQNSQRNATPTNRPPTQYLQQRTSYCHGRTTQNYYHPPKKTTKQCQLAMPKS